MKVFISLILFTLSIVTYGLCGEVAQYGCESYSDTFTNIWITSYRRYSGNYSCFSYSNTNYFVAMNQSHDLSSLTIEVEFKTTDNGNHNVRVVEDGGAMRQLSRTQNASTTGADGQRWYHQKYSYTYPASKTGTMSNLRLRIRSYSFIDDFSYNLGQGGGSGSATERHFTLESPNDFNVNVDVYDIFNAVLKPWDMSFKGKFTGNDEVRLSLVPVTTPFLKPSCENITGFNYTVDATEAGNDNFTIECIDGNDDLGGSLYFKIVNQTNKSYCKDIDFTISTNYLYELDDEATSSSFSTTFDIRSKFHDNSN